MIHKSVDEILDEIERSTVLYRAIKRPEVRCSELTATDVVNDFAPSPRVLSPFEVAVGLPVIVDENVPYGKMQMWEDGEMVKEFDAL